MTPIVINEELTKRLKKVGEKNSIANYILGAEISEDGDYVNYLGVSEQNPHYISYLTGKKIKTLQEEQYWERNKRYHTKPASFIELLFPNTFTAREKEIFTELFRNEGLKQNVNLDALTIVKGEDIRKYYYSGNYSREWDEDEEDYLELYANGSNILFESCMRYDSCENYFDIYCKNVNQVSMAVMLNPKGRVRARCILWTIGDKIYHDRIYSICESVEKDMHAIMEAKGFINISSKNTIKPYSDMNLRFKLDYGYGDISEFPYVDTMCNLEDNYVDNYGSGTYTMDNQDGTVSGDGYTCEWCESRISPGDEITIDIGRHRFDVVCSDCCHHSEYYDEFLHQDDSVYSSPMEDYILERDALVDYSGDWIHTEKAVELHDGGYAYVNDDDLCHTEDDEYFIAGDEQFTEIDGDWYNIDDDNVLFSMEGDYFLKGDNNYVEIEGDWYETGNDSVIEIEGEYYLKGSQEAINLLNKIEW